MKKSLLVLAMMAALLGARAQDTVTLRDVRSIPSYYIPPEWPHFPEDFVFDSVEKSYRVYLAYYGLNRRQEAAMAFRVLTDDTLKVYGLASAICLGNRYCISQEDIAVTDTSSPYASVWTMLFAPESDSLRELVDTSYTYVHGWQRPSYYLTLDLLKHVSPVPHDLLPPLPIYERYFPSAVSVTDSFYIGVIIPQDPVIEQVWQDVVLPSLVTDYEWTGRDTTSLHQWIHWNYHSLLDDTNINIWHAGIDHKYHPLCFPILTPQDSTVIVPRDTVTGSDTLGVRPADLLNRYTSLSPNPANDVVRVISSFRLTEINVYNIAGRLHFATKANGYVAKLAVSSWPRGTYIVRITTPLGTTVKKLQLE